MQITTYINDLLYRYECVIIPGFGALLTQYQSAKIDGEKIADKSVKIMSGTEGVFQVGKRKFAKVNIT